MICYDGTYRLKPSGQGRVPIRRWNNAWRIRIIDLSFGRADVRYLRPMIIVAVRTGFGGENTTCARRLGRRVCRDFDLDPQKVLWVEGVYGDDHLFQVATFTHQPSSIRLEPVENVTWRPLQANEIDAIQPFVPEVAGP
jgi:hypothetical protein